MASQRHQRFARARGQHYHAPVGGLLPGLDRLGLVGPGRQLYRDRVGQGRAQVEALLEGVMLAKGGANRQVVNRQSAQALAPSVDNDAALPAGRRIGGRATFRV